MSIAYRLLFRSHSLSSSIPSARLGARSGSASALGAALLALALVAGCGSDADSSVGAGGGEAGGPSSASDGSGGSTTDSSGVGGGSNEGGGNATGSGAAGGSNQGGGNTTSSGGAGGGVPADGYGSISGVCGVIDPADLASPNPELVQNVLDFTGEGPFSIDVLSPGGATMLEAGNLGGSSLESEVMAFEVLHRCEGAELVATEAQIVYAIEGKKTDLLVTIDGSKVGVSVVRAMSYPETNPYPVTQAQDVLTGKLSDILQSSANVAPEYAWEKQILAVVAQSPVHAASIEQAWANIDPAVRADTIVYVTTTNGDDAFIY